MLSKEQLFKITKVDQHSRFQNKIEELIFDKLEREEFYRKCLRLNNNCLDEDIFMQYFEEYATERKSNKQEFTPVKVTELIEKLTETNDDSLTIYDACAGTGSLSIAKWNVLSKKIPNNKMLFICEELSDNAIPYLIHNCAIRNMNAIIIHGDSIDRKTNEVYWICDQGEQFSSIDILPKNDTTKKAFNIKEWVQ